MMCSLNRKYKHETGIKEIKREEQMIELLKSLEKEFSKIKQSKIISPRGKIVKTFRYFIASILDSDVIIRSISDNNINFIHKAFDRGVFFRLEGTESICGIEIKEARVEYSLLEAYELLIQYRLDAERREKNCIYLSKKDNDPKFYCTFFKDKHCIGNCIYVYALTDCPEFKYDQEFRIKGRNGSDPKSLNELLKELFGFSLELREWQSFSPLFHKFYSKALSN